MPQYGPAASLARFVHLNVEEEFDLYHILRDGTKTRVKNYIENSQKT